ncbi:transposase [Streptomyces sp. NPDC047017]|uniref:IS701 family transposase n=1 Tax=Streptomyces sp. NPDC047017 TaxID=3155024 RepID=UPI0033D78E11
MSAAGHRGPGPAGTEHGPLDAAIAGVCAAALGSLRRKDQRARAEQYVRGLLTTPGRKSIRNIAAQVGGAGTEQSLHHFISSSTWDWLPIREALAVHVEESTAPAAWVVHPLTIPKSGRHSVGVGHRFDRHLDQMHRGQQAFGLWSASAESRVPVSWRMHLPDQDPGAGIVGVPELPGPVGGETYEECAIDTVLDGARPWRTAGRPVLLDVRGTGTRSTMNRFAAAGVPVLARADAETELLVADASMPGYGAGPLPGLRILESIRGLRRTVVWGDTAGPGRRTSLVVSIPVMMPDPASARRRPLLLLGEWPDPRRAPARLWLTDLLQTPAEVLLRLAKLAADMGRRTAHAARDVGLRDFVGRSLHGWHRHLTMASLAYAAHVSTVHSATGACACACADACTDACTDTDTGSDTDSGTGSGGDADSGSDTAGTAPETGAGAAPAPGESRGPGEAAARPGRRPARQRADGCPPQAARVRRPPARREGAALRQLAAEGVSPWLDGFHRGDLESGRLVRLVGDRMLRGLVWHGADLLRGLRESDAYADPWADGPGLRTEGPGPWTYGPGPWTYGPGPRTDGPDPVHRLVTQDVRRACDLLLPVFRETRGAEGLVSVELDPALTGGAAGIVAEAVRLRDAVARPNLLVRIPVTRTGLTALTACVARGIGVHACSVACGESYARAAHAYFAGLEQAVARGLDPASVASVLTVPTAPLDTAVDALLGERADDRARALRGAVATANARAVHHRHDQALGSRRWAALAAAGARPQRLLWTQCGPPGDDQRPVDGPAGDPVRYVEDLVAWGTGHVMGWPLLEAVTERGTLRGDSITGEYGGAAEVLRALGRLGIRCEEVAGRLRRERRRQAAGSWRQLREAARHRAGGGRTRGEG